MKSVAKFVVGLMTLEATAVALAYAATANWKMSVYWLGIAMVNGVAYTF